MLKLHNIKSCVWLLLFFSAAVSSETVIINLEEPNPAGVYTGIANLRGWAVAESGIASIEIDIDGDYAFDVPMGGARGDVAKVYPDFPDAAFSGFSMALNYKGLAPGDHVFTARAISRDGSIATQDARVAVDRFLSEYIDDASQVDTSTVSEVSFADSTFTLKGLTVEGRQWDIVMGFDTATQGFAISDIAALDGPNAGTACSSASWSSGDYTLEQNGIARQFRIRLPAGYSPDQTYPLVVLFHGWGGDEGEFLDNVTVQSQSDQRGYVLVAPLGLGREEVGNRFSSWSFQGSTTGLDGDGLNSAVSDDTDAICDDDRTTDYTYPSCDGIAENGCSWTQCSVDDVAFAAALVKEVSANVCVDSERVYAVGGSNGGMFVWDLARDQRSADVFTAVAPVLGLPHRGYLDPPISDDGMPVISVTGLRDRTVPPGEWGQEGFTTTSDGDVYYYSSASAITKVWAESQGCDTTVPAEPVDVGTADIECRGWSYCQSSSQWPPVLDCRGDMGHMYNLSSSWPLILDFFEQL